MTTKTLDRVVELWPALSEEVRETIVELAESSQSRLEPLFLTEEERRLIDQSREDFKQGRAMTLAEFEADLDGLFAEIAQKPGSAPDNLP